jgi:restriction system protein
MTGHWVIAPVESDPPDQFDKVWKFDLANNLITIGWEQLGDISRLSHPSLSVAVAEKYPEKPASTKSLIVNMLWRFFNEIGAGDRVIARRGRKVLAGVGKVTQPAIYSPQKNPHINHPNILGVSWEDSPRDKEFPSMVFPMHTVAPISEEEFLKLVGKPPESEDVSDEVENRQEFVLEKYLEDFIVTNFNGIAHFKGLKIFEEEGVLAQQYETRDPNVGRIDILAQETKSPSSFVVIELKKGRPADKVVGQVLRYMGWVQEKLCGEGQTVRGLVICKEYDPRLSYALKVTKNIGIRYYKISFELRESPAG